MNLFLYPDKKDWNKIIARPVKEKQNLNKLVSEVFKNVSLKGDEALKKYSLKFDACVPETFKVSKDEISAASKKVSDNLKKAIDLASKNIKKFHENQIPDEEKVNTTEGVKCWRKPSAIQKVGLYIPGGTAPLFSTVLMLGIPAKIAGCSEIILCTPPDKNGKINPAILYAAKSIGITQIYKVGGIQAIAALTFGTESIPKVYKIFGPGNQFVTAAKEKATTEGIAIDMPAGPSEVLVFADETANPVFIAADLLSQAEHGVDSQCILVSTNEKILTDTQDEINKQLLKLSRKEICEKSLENSKMILVNNIKEAMELINEYAPEHFIVMCENEDYVIDHTINAGSVFLGDYTPESAGDYASGTNHTLPTNGFAKAYSGVSLDSFLKKITFQKISKKGLQNIGPAIETMAKAEHLTAHKNAVTLRLKSLE